MTNNAPRRARPRPLTMLSGLLVTATIAGFLAWSFGTPSAAGTPRLVLDRTVIDFGDVSYGRYVTAEFTLKNAGDGPLVITDTLIVKALRGC